MTDVHICEIISNVKLTNVVHSITVSCAGAAREAKAGQFFGIRCGDGRILRRPISICRVSGEMLEFVFEVKGEGTKWLSDRRPGQELDALGPLGKGFDIPDGRFIVVGGGIGTPPLLFAARERARLWFCLRQWLLCRYCLTLYRVVSPCEPTSL